MTELNPKILLRLEALCVITALLEYAITLCTDPARPAVLRVGTSIHPTVKITDAIHELETRMDRLDARGDEQALRWLFYRCHQTMDRYPTGSTGWLVLRAWQVLRRRGRAAAPYRARGLRC